MIRKDYVIIPMIKTVSGLSIMLELLFYLFRGSDFPLNHLGIIVSYL